MRRAKTTRVKRTRAGNRWTEAQFWQFIRSGLRQTAVRWPPRSEVLKHARRKYNGPDKRRKWEYQCSECERWLKQKEVQVDHRLPCGKLNRWEDVERFMRRLFCEIDGLQVICKQCHERKTRGER